MLEVAPLILEKLELSELICHWYVQVPVPPEVEEETEALPPVQIVVVPDAEIEGSATTVTVCALETGSEQPDPEQFLLTR